MVSFAFRVCSLPARYLALIISPLLTDPGLRSIKALMTGNDGLTPREPKPPGVPKFYASQDLLEEAFQYVNRFKGVGNYHGIQWVNSVAHVALAMSFA
jgi:hypothetical protein